MKAKHFLTHEPCSQTDCPNQSLYRCDWRLRTGGRKKLWRPCNKALCHDHASFRGGDMHLCPLHRAAAINPTKGVRT